MTSPHRIGWIVAGAVATALLGALVLTVGVFGGGAENVITGAAFLALAAGWGVLAVGSIRLSDQPQRWAIVPAVLFASLGGLFISWPGVVVLGVAVWLLPLVMLALAIWIWTRARASLRSRTRRWLLNPLVALIAVASVAALAEAVWEKADRRAYPMHGALVDVGGFRLHLDCTGAGSPTVVLIAGAGELSSAWGWVAPPASRESRVCVYDRAGRGWSEATAGRPDGITLARDLHALLQQAGVTEPVVLVGHSFGGLYARIFASEYPEQVAGMVLLDATHPEMFTRVSAYPAFYEGYRRLSALFPSLARLGAGRLAYRSAFDERPVATRGEQLAFWSTAALARSQRDEWTAAPTVMRQARAAGALGDKPLVVVTAMRDAQDGWLPLQDELASLSRNSVHRIAANATHAALVDSREVSLIAIQAIHDAVTSVRGH